MADFPYRLTEDDRNFKRFGVIVLQADETIEDDLRQLIPRDLAKLHFTRIRAGAELTPETIGVMAKDLTRSASLLPDTKFDVIAYACTSGTSLIGAKAVTEQVQAGKQTTHVTNPLTAAFKAVAQTGAHSLAIISPYIEPVSKTVCDAFIAQGYDVPVSVSFGEKTERNVARIDPASIKEAALKAVEDADPDCIFLSCTNLRTLEIIAELEAETGRTVLSSNQVLAWHMSRLARLRLSANTPGKLFSMVKSAGRR